MKRDVSDEIQNAIIKLNLKANNVQLLDDKQGAAIYYDCVNCFLNSGDRRWWWEDFRLSSRSVTGLDMPFQYIDKIIPLDEGNVWFIAEEDDASFYPVYDCNPRIISMIISECFSFEYYIIDKNKEWLLCENHHGRFIGIGNKLNWEGFELD